MIRVGLSMLLALSAGACAAPAPPYELAVAADPHVVTPPVRYSDVAGGTRTFRPVAPSSSGWGAQVSPAPRTGGGG